ncbi:MAG: thioredoxin family protein [Elusimicrobia bacterium CG11_big_fil_rev_8_21_14_0_20_64_6]|nr:MAG: thioredoxin family protein [Elusimicrobia bacterium CG11_big_fil_rev_8_21_14_0_20_64_6]
MKAASFELLGTDGKGHTLDSLKGAAATIIVFSCNHCPYVVKAEDALIAACNDYTAKGVGMAAINSNDSDGYPEDSYENMIVRAAAKKFPFAYLRDESQAVAKAYGATHTPQLFVFDRDLNLAYTGAVEKLRDALDELVAGRAVRTAETHAIGCTIKWK